MEFNRSAIDDRTDSDWSATRSCSRCRSRSRNRRVYKWLGGTRYRVIFGASVSKGRQGRMKEEDFLIYQSAQKEEDFFALKRKMQSEDETLALQKKEQVLEADRFMATDMSLGVDERGGNKNETAERNRNKHARKAQDKALALQKEELEAVKVRGN